VGRQIVLGQRLVVGLGDDLAAVEDEQRTERRVPHLDGFLGEFDRPVDVLAIARSGVARRVAVVPVVPGPSAVESVMSPCLSAGT